jgi:hypothetical protein
MDRSGLLALIFLFTGGMKLVLPVEEVTKQRPLPGLLLRFIGVAEVLGAIGLTLPGLLRIRPGLTPLAAAGGWRRIAGRLTRHKVPKGQVEQTRKISFEIMKEPGCEQFEVFQSVVNSDKLTILERWTDQKALDTHARLQSTRPPLRPELRTGNAEREDYTYNRTR